MAIVRFQLSAGLPSPLLRLYTLSSGTVVDNNGYAITQLVEGLHQAIVPDNLVGDYYATVRVGSTLMADGYVKLVGGAGTAYIVGSQAELAAATAVGSQQVTIQITDSGNVPLPNIRVTVQSASSTAIIGYGNTDNNGRFVLGLNPGSYKTIIGSSVFYVTPVPSQFTVSAGANPTFTYVLTNIPTTAPLPGMCRVDIYVYDQGAAIRNAVILAESMDVSPTINGAVLVNSTVTALTNSNGYGAIQLPKASTYTSGNGLWNITITEPQTSRIVFERKVKMPDQNNVNLEDLAAW